MNWIFERSLDDANEFKNNKVLMSVKIKAIGNSKLNDSVVKNWANQPSEVAEASETVR